MTTEVYNALQTTYVVFYTAQEMCLYKKKTALVILASASSPFRLGVSEGKRNDRELDLSRAL